MDKLEIIDKIGKIYADGGNILSFLRGLENRNNNTAEDIMISYDFQAGTYNSLYRENPDEHNKYVNQCAEIIGKYIPENQYTLCEAGVGEGTTFLPLLRQLKVKPSLAYGFDISWSRIFEAVLFEREFTDLREVEKKLFVGDIFETAFADNSIDIVYTSHALEPNGGMEKQLLAELYRITGKYLILFEPIFEFGSEESKQRMIKYGYVRGLRQQAEELGYSVVQYERVRYSKPLNPTGVLVIKKEEQTAEGGFCDPISQKQMTEYADCYFCKDSMLSYPKIGGIPCLMRQNAVLTTRFAGERRT